MSVQVPGQVTKPTGDDLAQPINELLRRLSLESKEDTRDPMAMIKPDALGLTKWVTGLIGAGGLVSGAFGSFVAWNVGSGNAPLKVAIVAAVALVVSASILMVGWVTTTDVQARAETQQSRYAARGRIVTSYFDLVEKADFQRPPAAVEVTVDGR